MAILSEKGLEDSGERDVYKTGAMREPATGKGEFYTMPPDALLRLSKHYEAGSLKYSPNNYRKGIVVSRFIDSTLRHIYKYLSGRDNEDHLAAAAFNILGAMQMELCCPEMQDIEERKGKKIFTYE